MEHTSHHPPISNFLMIDHKKRYTYYGYYEYKASLSFTGNLSGRQEGPNIVRFEDGQIISYSLPKVSISGLLFGDRIIEWVGNMIFKDEKNDLSCKLQFYEGGLFSRKAHPSDYFE